MKLSDVQKNWGDGYLEDFRGYKDFPNAERRLADLIPRCGSALEIGCGGGFWSDKYLTKNCREVVGVDIIDRPGVSAPNFRYVQVPEFNCDLPGIDDQSIDFVWCFGVFCHMRRDMRRGYLKSIRRVMHNEGVAVCMFAKDRGYKEEPLAEEPLPWFYDTFTQSAHDIIDAGFTCLWLRFHDFRDNIIEFA